jgi:hypothetical protein
VNAPLVSLQSKNLNNAKSEIRFKQLIRSVIRGAFTIDSSTPTLRINLNEQLILQGISRVIVSPTELKMQPTIYRVLWKSTST